MIDRPYCSTLTPGNPPRANLNLSPDRAATMDTLLNTILQLPPTDRLQLIQKIWDSLDPSTEIPLSEPQSATLDRHLGQSPRQGWGEQFATAANDEDRDREWLDSPLSDWDNTEWEW